MQSNKILTFVTSLIAFILIGCLGGKDYEERDRLIDQYYLYKYSENSYKIQCKLACESDFSVEGNITKVWIEDKAMVVELDFYKYHLIISDRDELKCCNNNKKFKFTNINGVDSILNKYNIKIKDMDIEYKKIKVSK